MAKSKKIIDNPTPSKLLEQIYAIQKLERIYKITPFSRKLFPQIGNAFDQFKQTEILQYPDQFNERFSTLGWIAYESMSLDVIQKSIAIYETDGQSKAEDFLTDSYDETTLNQGILRLKGNDHFQKRIRLIELAKDDYLSNRYHACIPLLLSLLDGLSDDISSHVGFFAKNIDLTTQDSIAAHESGLQTLSSLMSQSRKKTNEEIISIPYRNGILHGRELNFDNKIVAAKCWAALFAIKDWAESLESNKQELKPKVTTHWKILKKAREEWRPRSSDELMHLPFEGDITNLPKNTPEYAVAMFIDHWCNKRFGPMADLLSHNIHIPQANRKVAGDVKKDFGTCIPMSFRIISIEDERGYITLVKTEIYFEIHGQKKSKPITVRTEYYNSENQRTIRSLSGQWKITQRSFNPIIDPSNL